MSCRRRGPGCGTFLLLLLAAGAIYRWWYIALPLSVAAVILLGVWAARKR